MSSPHPVEIVTYNDNWPAVFAAAKPRIEQALDPDARIEHVGSTSVPGLGAKAIVDIMVGLPSEDALDSSVAPLQALGYEYVPEFESEMPYRRYFRMSENGRRTQHVHVVAVTHEFWERHLLFRDYLRAHPEAARDYEQLKRELATKHSNAADYTDAKTEFITGIEAKARAEREAQR